MHLVDTILDTAVIHLRMHVLFTGEVIIVAFMLCT